MAVENKNPEWLVPGYPKLKGIVGQAAVNGQLVQYPMVVRSGRDPPVPGQSIALVSYSLFEKPMIIKDTGSDKPVYGMTKVRGVYPDPNSAHNAAAELIQKVDSRFKILFLPVGAWGAVTENLTFIEKSYDVKTTSDEKEITLRSKASRDKADQEARLAKELQEGLDEAVAHDTYDEPQSLEYYTMKRMTDFKLRSEIRRYEEHIAKMRESLEKTDVELQSLEEGFPSYKNEWFEFYNKELIRRNIQLVTQDARDIRGYYTRMGIEEIPKSGELGAEETPVLEGVSIAETSSPSSSSS